MRRFGPGIGDRTRDCGGNTCGAGFETKPPGGYFWGSAQYSDRLGACQNILTGKLR